MLVWHFLFCNYSNMMYLVGNGFFQTVPAKNNINAQAQRVSGRNDRREYADETGGIARVSHKRLREN